MPTQERAPEDSLQRLHHDLEAEHADGLWRRAGDILTPEPTKRGEPYLWRWESIEPLLRRAGQLVPVERGGERRVIRFINPSLEAPSSTTHTLSATFQYLLPGETAPVHRHTPAAIRFVVSGKDAYTAVEGEQISMEPGDLILTPSWTWHGHGNPTDEPVTWIDAIDTPLIQKLTAMFFEPGEAQIPSTSRPGYTSRAAGKGWMIRPETLKDQGLATNGALPLIYRWSDIEPILKEPGAERSPFDGDLLRYANPVSGSSSTLPTIGCTIQRLLPGEKTNRHRHLSSTVYYVFKGRGESTIDGKVFRWKQGDMLSLPTWSWHSHEAASEGEAILFGITDDPVMKLLGLYREEGSQ